MGVKMRQMEIPAAFAAINSYVSPKLPKVMIEASKIESGKASGIIRLASGAMHSAQLVRSSNLALDLLTRRSTDIGFGPGLIRKQRQTFQHGGGRAIALKQVEKRQSGRSRMFAKASTSPSALPP